MFDWKDLIETVNNTKEYKLREISTDTFWSVEAYFNAFIKNKSLKIIFKDDVIYPSRKYTQEEIDKMISELDERYESIKQILL